MVVEHYGLIEEPFGVTPDPRFLYLGPNHREALASLLYGTEANRGFLALIAKPGMGKTSLLFQYLEHLRNKARTAFVFQTDCNSREFVRHILIDLGLDASGKDLPAMHEMLNQLLMEEMRAGRRFILVIDEAQNLKEKVLESVRLLSNFETPWMKLMQIVIAGQPQLAKRLAKPSLAQLRQRISLVIRIEPFVPEEINAYIDHRLWVAGYQGPSLFTTAARLMIAEHSEGIPRNINNICFNAMSLACALKRKTIDRDIICEVLADLDLESLNEGTAVVRKSEEEPKPGVSQTPRNVERKSRFRDWSPRFAAASLLLLALSWSVVHVNRTERQTSASQPLSAETTFIGPTPAPVFRGSTSLPTPDVSLTGLKAEAPPDQKIQVLLSQYEGTQSGAPAKHTIEQYRSITVMPGQTLQRISVKYFSKYNREIFEEIHELNPWLINPNHIQSGREIRIPSVKEDSGDEHPAAMQGTNTAARRVERP
jgi:general secretion pathway protein A